MFSKWVFSPLIALKVVTVQVKQQTSMAVHELLMELVHQSNKALIVVTHNLELAAMCKIHMSCMMAY